MKQEKLEGKEISPKKLPSHPAPFLTLPNSKLSIVIESTNKNTSILEEGDGMSAAALYG